MEAITETNPSANTTSTLAKPKRQIAEWLQGEDFRRELAAALPENMSPKRFIRIALTATLKNPDLLACTQESFFKSLLELSAMGLEPDGRRAHLIPYKEECGFIVDYKGIAELARRNGDVSYIHCDVVGEYDHFEYRFGNDGKLDHKPKIGDRGQIYCAYSFVRLADGTPEYEVMSVSEIEKIRARSKTPQKGPWVTDWPEMAKKTVFRRHSKTLPLSPQTREALEHDDDFEAIKPAVGQVVEPHIPGAAKPPEAEATKRPRGRPPKATAPSEAWAAATAIVTETARLDAAIRAREAEMAAALEANPPPKTGDDSLFTFPPKADPEPQQPTKKDTQQKPAPGPLEQVAARLAEAQAEPKDFLYLLAFAGLIEVDQTQMDNDWRLRAIETGSITLQAVPESALKEALADWDNALNALKQKPWTK